MLEKARPDVVHVTTPPTSHFRLAMDSFDAGAHVIVEKPATSTFEELETLVRRAQEAGRHLVEDHNCVFNQAPQEILRRIESGQFGAVTHVEVLICLDILGPGLRRSQLVAPAPPWPAVPSPTSPHLASLAHPSLVRIGPPRRSGPSASPRSRRSTSSVPWWTRSAGLRPRFQLQLAADAFWLRSTASGCRPPPTCSRRGSPSTAPATPKPLRPFFSGLEEGKTIRRAALHAAPQVQGTQGLRDCGSSCPHIGHWPTVRPAGHGEATSLR